MSGRTSPGSSERRKPNEDDRPALFSLTTSRTALTQWEVPLTLANQRDGFILFFFFFFLRFNSFFGGEF